MTAGRQSWKTILLGMIPPIIATSLADLNSTKQCMCGFIIAAVDVPLIIFIDNSLWRRFTTFADVGT